MTHDTGGTQIAQWKVHPLVEHETTTPSTTHPGGRGPSPADGEQLGTGAARRSPGAEMVAGKARQACSCHQSPDFWERVATAKSERRRPLELGGGAGEPPVHEQETRRDHHGVHDGMGGLPLRDQVQLLRDE